MRLGRTEVVGAVLVGGLFLLATWLSATYSTELDSILGACGGWGMLAYVLIALIATVVAPISATPLIPVAAALWGPVAAALLSLVGWTLGAVIAFWLARRYGYTFVARFVRLRRLQEYAEHLPKKHLFFLVILLRIVMPVDVLSYVLGLFSTMSLGSYTLATVIGITPFAFIFAYAATLPLWLQAIALLLVGIFLFVSYRELRKRMPKRVADRQ